MEGRCTARSRPGLPRTHLLGLRADFKDPMLGDISWFLKNVFPQNRPAGSGSSGVPGKAVCPFLLSIGGWVWQNNLRATPLCFGSMVPFLEYNLQFSSPLGFLLEWKR